jgi:signal transduction histidine kinase/CheY-like chemotaxis protein
MTNPLQIPDDDDLKARRLFIGTQKFLYMIKSAKSSGLGMLLGALLCIPLLADKVSQTRLVAWEALLILSIFIRFFILWIPGQDEKIKTNVDALIARVNFATLITSLAWGAGWFILAFDMGPTGKMEYFLVMQMVTFLGMMNYCVHAPTFAYFFIPFKLPELLIVVLPSQNVEWPLIFGSIITALYSIKMARAFSKSWEGAVELKIKNEDLFEKLTRERDVSELANIAKSNFIAVASHDLRQPMHAITLYLGALDVKTLGAKNKAIFTNTSKAVSTINSMFSALLNISKFDAQNVVAKNESIQLSAIASALDNICAPYALTKGLFYRSAYTEARVFCDPLLLKQALLNIISNAIQYTEYGGVNVKFISQAGLLTIEISDTGKGIDEADGDYIYQEFYRSAKLRSYHDGLGLGLSIVQRICSLTDSKISFESVADEGTTFRLTTKFAISDSQESEGRVYSAGAPPIGEAYLGGLIIGLLENTPSLRSAYVEALHSRGCEVIQLTEDDAELARTLSCTNAIDCLLVDYHLDTGTGDDFVAKIRENFNLDIPAIVVSGDTSPLFLDKLKNQNLAVLHKPVDIDLILNAIRKLTSKKLAVDLDC